MTRGKFRHHWIWTVIITICLCSVHQISWAQTVEEMYQNQDSVNEKEVLENDSLEHPSGSGVEDTQPSLTSASSDHPLVLFATFIFYLVLVLALIYVLIRFLGARQRKMQNHSVFQNLGGLGLGTNKSLQLIKIGQSLYVIGVADQITLIKEIKNSDEMDFITKQMEEQENMLSKRFLGTWPWNKKGNEEQQAGEASFQTMFQESIKQHQVKQKEAENKLEAHISEQREGRFK